MKKIILSMLAAICIVSLICACTPNESVLPTPSASVADPTPDNTPTPGVETATISDFTIIYPEFDFSAQKAALRLSIALLDKGISLTMHDDIIDEDLEQHEEKYEILIGRTNRAESASAASSTTLRSRDHLIKSVGNKITVIAGSEKLYDDAIDQLAEICKSSSVDDLSAIDTVFRYGNSPDGFFIDGNSLENYTVVCSDPDINKRVIDDILSATGYTLSFGNADVASEYEIIIGNIQRDEVINAKNDLRDLDYSVKIENGKIVITGGTNSMLPKAYETFVSEFLATSVSKKEFSSGNNSIIHRHDYPVSSIKLLGSDISEYVILAKSADDRAANVIREYINELYGLKLEIVTDGAYEKAIVLGNVGTRQYQELTSDLKKDEYIIKTVGKRLYLGTVANDDYYEDGPAVHKLLESYFGFDLVYKTASINSIEINEISEVSKIDDYLMKVADDVFLAEIDAKADNLKNMIINSTTTITYTGTAYYVSNDGNDSNDGLTPETSWATLDRVTNAKELKKGDAVLFKRGDIFRGHMGTVAGVTYSAYGEGIKPRIWGSPVDGAVEYEWIEVAPDVWKYTYFFDDSDIGAVILNHGEKVAIKICPDYSHTPVLNDWTKEPFSYKTMNTLDLYFFSSTEKNYARLFDTDYGYLYMCCKAGNPADVFDSIEFNTKGTIMSCEDGTTIDNLWVQYGGSHGINAGRNNCTIQNCEVSYIGGCYQGDGASNTRFGNGIELWGSGTNFTIAYCYVHDCFDTGITQQGSNNTYENIQYHDNLLDTTNANIEYFQYLDAGNEKSYIKGFKIYNNICRFAGYGWGAMRSSNVNGGPYFHITGLGACRRPEGDDSAIYNNIFQYSRKWLIRTLADQEEWLIPYYDNIFIEYEGGYVGSAANTTGDKHGVWSDYNYSGIDSWEYRKNTFYVVEQ